MKRKRFLKVTAMILCLAAVSVMFAGMALTDDYAQNIPDKQREIDRYLFEDHADDIAAKGITVTHTAPMDGFVEIGIAQYTDEKAEYLYGIFGRDLVKVVEGQQAVLLTEEFTTLEMPLADNAIPQEILDKQAEIDKCLFEDNKDDIAAKGFTVTHTGPLGKYVEIGIAPYTEENAEYLYSIFGRDLVKVVEGEQAYPMEGVNQDVDADVISAEDKALAPVSPVLTIVLISAALIAAGTAFFVIRRKAAHR